MAKDDAARRHDPERTKSDILAVAHEEFAQNGLAGARVDAIASRTKTTKRMIYYYFGSKEGLYLAVLERAYGDIRNVEQSLRLDDLSPEDAIRAMIDFTFDYQDAHPEFIRLVAIENIHHGKYLAQSDAIKSANMSVIESLRRIMARGQRDGIFRADVDPVDIHMMISALCFFRVSNRYTFGTLFDIDFSTDDTKTRHKRLIGDAVVGALSRERATGVRDKAA